MSRQVAAGARRVALEQLGVRREAAGRRGVVGPQVGGVAVAPVHAEVADVGERVAQRAQLPVEHGGDAAAVPRR